VQSTAQNDKICCCSDPHRVSGGFTLVELIVVIMITGVIAASIAMFFRPAIDSYFDTQRRADMTDLADTALRRMAQDIRRAVPNSIQSGPATCFRLVPTIAGGRYRMGPDTVNDTSSPCTPGPTCSAPLDTSVATTVFDVLTPLAKVPVEGDWIVINNQNGADVYDGTNRAAIISAEVLPLRSTDGQRRISVDSRHFPVGYDGGRFVVVANAEQTLTYTCIGGVLYRKIDTFNNPINCSAGGPTQIVATDVQECTFAYDPNHGATQQSGYVWMRLVFERDGERVVLMHGVHVSNVP